MTNKDFKQILLFSCTVMAFAFPATAQPAKTNVGRLSARLNNAMSRLENDVAGFEKDYNAFKSILSDKYGLQYALDVSFLAQKGVPNGGKTAMQTIYAPSVSWQMFNSDTFGSGTIDFSYTATRYWGNKASNVGNKLYLATPVNDYTTPSNAIDQLSYTHALFDNKLAVTAGQYFIADFDGMQYASNQQTGFVNYALAQNASATYPIAGLGAYVQVNPTAEWSFTGGFQNAGNVSGQTLSTKGGRQTTFGSIAYTPTVNGQAGQYALLVYHQPSVKAQPQNTTGWSVNLAQNLNKNWGVFARANAASGDSMPIKQSYAAGGVYNRTPSDQIGFAVAYNKVAKGYFDSAEPMRNFETVVESYWNIGVTQFFTIAPDVQVYVHPASKRDRNFGTVFGLRGTLLL